MKHSLNFSADVIRARVKALSALQNMIDGGEHIPLNTDANPALNQLIVFAFGRALIQLAPHVAEYTVEPNDFHSNPTDLLMLEAIVDAKEGRGISWSMVVSVVEDYIANRVMAEVLSGSNPASTLYMNMADESMDLLREIMADGAIDVKLRRSY